MIQLNLLPDVKIAFIKARAQKRLVILSSLLVGAVTLGIFILLFLYVNVVQATDSKNLTSDIEASAQELSNTKDLNKILTVQNQLKSIDGLHAKKPAIDRIPTYIAKTTPAAIKSLQEYQVDFELNTISITGKSPNLEAVNAYANTLKQFNFTTKEQPTPKKAFSDVVLSSFTRNTDEATFTITLKFVPVIFDSGQEVALVLPGSTTPATNNNAFGGGQ